MSKKNTKTRGEAKKKQKEDVGYRPQAGGRKLSSA
jgi:hypothetical protein